MSLGYYLKRAVSLPPHVVLQRASGMAWRKARARYARLRDARACTFAPAAPAGELFHYLAPVDLAPLRSRSEEIAVLADHALAHRFDLLGSGWVRVAHGRSCAGVEGHQYDSGPPVQPDPEGKWLQGRINASNLKASQQIWSQIAPNYAPIDWHLDFKSGYRWSERVWSPDIRYAHLPGVDVKVPWELARMQHLPTLSWAFALASAQTPGFREPAAYAAEFRHQVLDFIATNPPRYGVNWRTTMDVAIRAVNWLIAYDLLRAHGASFDMRFEEAFARSILEHGRHIVTHLEWHEVLRGNHYLSDIVGLLFVAAYLPRSRETDAWLALASQELLAETELQFFSEGANFEASTCYHRLSAEMVAYATALLMGLPAEKRLALTAYDHRRVPNPPRLNPSPSPLVASESAGLAFPRGYIERLERMGAFTAALTRPDGRVSQFGDNDSGRFLKLTPAYCRLSRHEISERFVGLASEDDSDAYWLEDALDHNPLVSLIDALFGIEEGASLEAAVVRSLACGGALERGVRMDSDGPLVSFPEVGNYRYRNSHLWLAFRCGTVGQRGFGGHGHNDALSFEAAVDGVSFVVDPGTYLYTPAPAERNRFRSTAMHATLSVPGQEQNGWEDEVRWLFGLQHRAHARVLESSHERITGEHAGFGSPHRRTLTMRANGVSGIDTCDLPGEKHVCFPLAPEVTVEGLRPDGVLLERDGVRVLLRGGPGTWSVAESGYSPAYGVLQRNRKVRLTTVATRVEWELSRMEVMG